MSNTTASVRVEDTFPAEPDWSFWVHAAETGLLAGLIFGLWFQFTMGSLAALGTVYELGEPALSFPWVVHMLHSILFAMLFVVVVDSDALRGYASHPASGAAIGAGFGFLLWAVILLVFQPFWMATVAGSMATSEFAAFASVRPLAAHLLWGLLVGGLFPQLRQL